MLERVKEFLPELGVTAGRKARQSQLKTWRSGRVNPAILAQGAADCTGFLPAVKDRKPTLNTVTKE
jgi:hypothetical protein